MKRINKPKDYRKPVLIVCEGELESFYFKALESQYQGDRYFDIRCNGGKGPQSIVGRAVGLRRGDYPEAWCVMDVEDPGAKGLARAVSKAKKHKISLALTNPSFDAWALAHFAVVLPEGARSVANYKYALHKKLGRPFRESYGEKFALEVIDENCCNIQQAEKHITLCASDDVTHKAPSTSVHNLVELFTNPSK